MIDVNDDASASERQHLCELVDTVQEVFWLANAANTELLYVSPAYEQVFGRSRAALRADIHDWINALHADDRARMQAFTRASPEVARQERFRVVHAGGEVRVVDIRVFPVCEDDQVVRLAGVATDVTERLLLEEQVRQTQKLESLGLLAGGVAHDFNNILAVVAANASFLREAGAGATSHLDVIDEIERAVERGTGLTRQLLAFSRKQAVAPAIIDLNAIVNETGRMLRRMVGEDIVITMSLQAELGRAKIDAGGLVQILMNLAVNARDAMPRGGRLSIATRNIERREVMLAIADNGCGMTAEVKARAFEPLFTTKDPGRGTGLGLSVVHGIVQQAGGRIEIDSELGVGTTLRLYLPFCESPVEQRSRAAGGGAGGCEKLIVVEDDPDVRCSLSRALRGRGYEVLEASDGDAALQLLDEHGKRIDLLVTDVVMPGMDGRELVETARRGRPTLRVLYISGYTDDAVLRHGIERSEIAVLEKPFPGDALAARVREILDEAKLAPRVGPAAQPAPAAARRARAHRDSQP